MRFALLLVAALASAGCETLEPTMNQPLAPGPEGAPPEAVGDLASGYRLTALPDRTTFHDVGVFLAFSGGGKRSAAFAYGVLEGLRDFELRRKSGTSRLLDEVDFISAVSGGSFTAAYYGLHRDKIFTDFERDFLSRDIESYIWGLYLLPWHWASIVNPVYGTNDQMAAIYDDLMFHGATYSDLQRLGRPLISINATNISYGFVFPFTQDYFDMVCSDLSQYPLSRAVAASNGFPILFSPITLENHADACGGWKPRWAQMADRVPPSSRARYLIDTAREFLDPAKTRYIHLVDGGVSDNLAMRGLLNSVVLLNASPADIHRRSGALQVRRLLLVSADGQASSRGAFADSRVVTGVGQILNVVSGGSIDQYNFETLQLARQELESLAANVRRLRCEVAPVIDGYRCDDVETHFAHFSLGDIADEATRKRLEAIPTGLTLSPEDVATLVEVGARVVRESPELERFRKGLDVHRSAPLAAR
ncbi:MAG TPA: patatin-like phospholipase family protein [Alphaproteobacteria bacterium]